MTSYSPTPGRATSRSTTAVPTVERNLSGGVFPPNGYGLFDMAGNVWEWTESAWQDHPGCMRVAPGQQPKGT